MKVEVKETRDSKGFVNGVELKVNFESAHEATRFVAILGGLDPQMEHRLIQGTKYAEILSLKKAVNVIYPVFDKLDGLVCTCLGFYEGRERV